MQNEDVKDLTSSVEVEPGKNLIFHFTEKKRGNNTWVVPGPITLNGDEISLDEAKRMFRDARQKLKSEESHE